VSYLFKDQPGESSSLFVIWANGRHREQEILQDLRDRFEVLKVVEVSWSPDRVAENYQRFYADIDVRGIYHRFSKGTGPFIAITLVDHSPVMEERMTSRGPRMVNGRFLDAKTLYREWAGELTIHCTENAWETDRDVFMLFGEGMAEHRLEASEPWSGEIGRLTRDLTGTGGWASEEELFAALNRAVEYVLLTAKTQPPYIDSGGETNLLATDGRAMHTILRTRPREPSPTGGTLLLRVGGRQLKVGLRHPEDGFFPKAFALRLLGSRKLGRDGSFRPGAREEFGALAYHELVHKPAAEPAGQERLSAIAEQLGVAGWTPAALANVQAFQSLLLAAMPEDIDDFVRPLDAAVYFNRPIVGQNASWPVHVADRAVCSLSRLVQGAGYLLRNLYWQTRDQLLIVAPGIRVVKRWVAG